MFISVLPVYVQRIVCDCLWALNENVFKIHTTKEKRTMFALKNAAVTSQTAISYENTYIFLDLSPFVIVVGKN